MLTRMHDLLPDYYDDILEIPTLVNAEQVPIDELAIRIEQNTNNQYVMASDTIGVQLWEHQLDLTPVPGDSLDARKFAILMRVLPSKPITERYLNDLFGILGINATATVDQLHLDVKIHEATAGSGRRLASLLAEYIPANVTYLAYEQNHTEGDVPIYVGMAASYNTDYKLKGVSA